MNQTIKWQRRKSEIISRDHLLAEKNAEEAAPGSSEKNAEEATASGSPYEKVQEAAEKEMKDEEDPARLKNVVKFVHVGIQEAQADCFDDSL